MFHWVAPGVLWALPILNERYLRRVLSAFVAQYNEQRLHQMHQQCPVQIAPEGAVGRIARREVLALITHESYRAAP